MTIEEMKQRKKELGYSYEQLSKLSDVPVGTIQKIFGGITKTPRYETISALEKVLSEKTRGSVVEEAVAYYGEKRQGEYTLEDYYALPDDQRVELIDGVFYDMSSPTHIHQIISGEIYNRISNYIKANKGNCVPAMAPLDVQLDCDNRTMIQPDVIILCDRDKFQRGVIYGAPDLVVEVLSKSTRKKDMFLKLTKYMEAGVREYWMVDPKGKRVLVYYFEEEVWPVIYSFEDTIPVNIYEGKCQIDFAEIYEYIEFLYDRF